MGVMTARGGAWTPRAVKNAMRGQPDQRVGQDRVRPGRAGRAASSGLSCDQVRITVDTGACAVARGRPEIRQVRGPRRKLGDKNMTPAELLRRIRGKKSLKDMFMYFPFSDYKKDQTLGWNPTGWRQSGLKFKLLKKSWQCLSRVGDDALLMVVGHGGPGSTDISMVGPKGEKSLSATELADNLVRYGLSKSHQSILLLSCFGGGTAEFATPGHTPGTDRRVHTSMVNVNDNAMGRCLAATLGKALGMRGFYSILVGGWPGAVGPHDDGVGSVFDTSNDEPILAQLDHIQWFDAKGQNTA